MKLFSNNRVDENQDLFSIAFVCVFLFLNRIHDNVDKTNVILEPQLGKEGVKSCKSMCSNPDFCM